MPSAFAATENLVVSADNKLFAKSFNGPMVIEVVVNDNDIDDLTNSAEPDVTVNGATLKMIQAGDGNWYAYIAENDIIGHSLVTDTLFGGEDTPGSDHAFHSDNTDAESIYLNTDIVVRQPKEPSNNELNAGIDSTVWPVVQGFDFTVGGDVTVTYAKGGNPQSITMEFLDDPDDFASLSLDRSSYPPGAEIHMTIQSLAHNIDPTDEDSWTYITADPDNSSVIYGQFNENGESGVNVSFTIDNLKELKFDDSAVLTIDTNPNTHRTPILEFKDNNDQIHDNVATNSQVTILETQPNSGIFKNTDKADVANIKVADNASRDYTGTIDFADNPESVPISNYPGSLVMDINGIGGTWNGGEEITVTLDDGDLNLNSLVDQDIDIANWAHKIPTVIIGSPLTLKDATITVGGNTPVDDPAIDKFSMRASITQTPAGE